MNFFSALRRNAAKLPVLRIALPSFRKPVGVAAAATKNSRPKMDDYRNLATEMLRPEDCPALCQTRRMRRLRVPEAVAAACPLRVAAGLSLEVCQDVNTYRRGEARVCPALTVDARGQRVDRHAVARRNGAKFSPERLFEGHAGAMAVNG